MLDSGFTSAEFSRVLDKIYAAGVDGSGWRNALEALSSSFDGARSMIYIADIVGEEPPQFDSWGIDDASIADYAEHYAALNPYPAKAHDRYEEGDAICCLDCISLDEALQYEFVHEWMKPNRWSLAHIGSVILKRPEEVGVLTISPQGDGAADRLDTHLAKLDALTPHVIRAARIGSILQDWAPSSADLGAALDQIDGAAFVVRGDAKVLAYNNKAGRLLRGRSVVSIDRADRLSCTDPQRRSAFKEAISRTEFGRGGGGPFQMLRLESADGGGGYVMWCAPCGEGAADSRFHPSARLFGSEGVSAHRLVIIRRLSGRTVLSPELVRVGLGLTRAEANIVCALAAGFSLFDYADRRKVSRHTVRKQLSGVFNKLGVSSQAELLVLASQTRFEQT